MMGWCEELDSRLVVASKSVKVRGGSGWSFECQNSQDVCQDNEVEKDEGRDEKKSRMENGVNGKNREIGTRSGT